MADTRPHPGSQNVDDLEDLYATPPPWDTGRPQPPFLALAEAGAIRGRVLDVGCGTGEHTLMAAGLGLDATGVDLASKALHVAENKASERGMTVRFLHHDVQRLGALGESYDTVLDSLVFHIFGGTNRTTYVESLRSVLRPGGRYFMLCFSDRQPGELGLPHKLTQSEINTAFSEGWQVDSIEPTTIDSTRHPDGIHGWLAAVTRI
jgi:cyclopropane fatty-acyl-phospholipid synthase-like methyltransferase